MCQEIYRGYTLWGHSIPQGGRYAGSGTVTQGELLLESSGVLGTFEADEEARAAGIAWARAWVDSRH